MACSYLLLLAAACCCLLLLAYVCTYLLLLAAAGFRCARFARTAVPTTGARLRKVHAVFVLFFLVTLPEPLGIAGAVWCLSEAAWGMSDAICLLLLACCCGCLGLSGTVWGCLGLSGAVWCMSACLGLPGACLGLSGAVWNCLGLSGTVWGCLELSGGARAIPEAVVGVL